MDGDLATYAKENGIKFFLLNFTDLFGVQRSKLVPGIAIGDMQVTGAGFAGFAAWLDMTPAHPDMFAVPDPSAVVQLPWEPEIAWVPGDLYMAGKPIAQAPRNVLQSVITQAANDGILMKAGLEAEFHLIGGLLLDNESFSDVGDLLDPSEFYAFLLNMGEFAD